ncbi:hypothetical protein [Nonomuraea harbinensis]|uniref:Uncharacterized protein n=1 Tax=Nonomuraea harbinensis TaxID=1286938 RepID=A0ABW1C5W1_9ACTN|nr:hypothetical protein [Nonomuraea harbinensis]
MSDTPANDGRGTVGVFLVLAAALTIAWATGSWLGKMFDWTHQGFASAGRRAHHLRPDVLVAWRRPGHDLAALAPARFDSHLREKIDLLEAGRKQIAQLTAAGRLLSRSTPGDRGVRAGGGD